MAVKKKSRAAFIISGGLCGLVVAMGVGRFAYTPLLPAMQSQFSFSDAVAGSIASLNFLGYLLGAVLCHRSLTPGMKLKAFRWALIISLLTTLCMGLFEEIAAWMILRLAGGVASAGIFVLGSAIVMDELQQSGSSHRAMLIYSGVGLGIALSGIVSPLLTDSFGVQIAWVGLAVICLPMVIWSWYTVIPESQGPINQTLPADAEEIEFSNILPWLVGAYFCEGFGYIVSGTFLVSFLQHQSGLNASGNTAWVIVGLTALISVPLFHLMAKRSGPVRVLIFAHVLQAIGILLPVMSNHWLAVNFGAVLFGATFMGITALSLFVGKVLRPDRSHSIIGLLTAVYGVGQILGPLISGILSTRTGSYTMSLTVSALSVAFGGGLLTIGMFRGASKSDLSNNHTQEE